MEKEYSLEKLKESYEVFKKKYTLPQFSELNKLFDIEDVDPDTDLLLRKIRRIVSDRLAGYSRFVEILLNPSNAPMYFFDLIKKFDNKDRESLKKIYNDLINFELELLKLDLNYSEKNEAEFIIKANNIFNNEIRLNLLEIMNKLTKQEATKKTNESAYFG